MLETYTAPCTPPLWAPGGHSQTLLAHVLPSPGPRIEPDDQTVRREIRLGDGDRLVALERAGTTGVRVHLFHGLSGDINAEYMRRTAAALRAAGHGFWAVNHRGCGLGKGLASRPYHSGKTEDLADVLRASRAAAPELVHLVIGFSLSGNLALLHAARRESPQPDGLIAVNPPVDLERASIDIERGLCRIYQARFMLRLRRAVRDREARGYTRGHYEIPVRTTLREFDDLFTAPECGFDDGRDYYQKCSSADLLHAIRTPAVIVAAADDPFVDPSTFERAAQASSVHLHIEERGGHVGYLSRRGLGWRRWLDGALVHYVAELARAARV